MRPWRDGGHRLLSRRTRPWRGAGAGAGARWVGEGVARREATECHVLMSERRPRPRPSGSRGAMRVAGTQIYISRLGLGSLLRRTYRVLFRCHVGPRLQ
jgi:hypothetical protein